MTKIVSLSGGLGNQMFQYAFGLALKEQGESERVVYLVRHRRSIGHHGFEISTVFNLKSIITLRSRYYSLLYIVIRHLPKCLYEAVCKILDIEFIRVNENFVYFPLSYLRNGNHKIEYYNGTWQSELFFENARNSVLSSFTFQKSLVSNESLKITSEMQSCNSISIHIRRGDYLSDKFINGFSNICDIEYYRRACNYFENHICDPVYFVFSDDIDWARQNLTFINCKFIDNNQGKNSWQDMFLMSCCNHNIIANSSFSWWGAYLNKNSEKIVIAPAKWWNGIKDDVVPNTWIRL